MQSLRIRFQGSPVVYTARFYKMRGHEGPFHALPTDALVIPQTNGLFVNYATGKHVRELTMEEARTWGTADPDDAETIFAKAHSKTSRFCLRLVLNPRKVVLDRGSPQFEAYQRLIYDAKFHSNHLSLAEGVVVPKHYGMWLMDTGDWAGQILFSLTDWGGISWNDLSSTKYNTEANRILVGRTIEILHDYGIEHGGIATSWATQLRHIVVDVYAPDLSAEDRLNGKASCYVVDFSEAQTHRCMRKLPILPMGSFVDEEMAGCSEISCALTLLAFYKPSNRSVDVPHVLEWHARYSEQNPSTRNLEVLLAQRAKFWPYTPSIYPGQAEIIFGPEDEYDVVIKELEYDEDASGAIDPDNVLSFRPPVTRDSHSPSPEPDSVDVATAGMRRIGLHA